MKYEVVFTPPAYNDLQLAFAWYEQERAGLGWEFRNEIALCVEKITKDTVGYRKVKGAVRKLPVSRFPYIIYFRKYLRKKVIVVAAVLHERRNPEEIRKRTFFVRREYWKI